MPGPSSEVALDNLQAFLNSRLGGRFTCSEDQAFPRLFLGTETKLWQMKTAHSLISSKHNDLPHQLVRTHAKFLHPSLRCFRVIPQFDH